MQVEELERSLKQGFTSPTIVKDEKEYGNLNLFERKKIVTVAKPKLSDGLLLSSKYLRFSQKKAYLAGLRRRVIGEIIVHLGVEIINPVE